MSDLASLAAPRIATGHAPVAARHELRFDYTRDLMISRARQGWLGRLARPLGLYGTLDDLWERGEEVELAIYRAHHAAVTAAASPLALDLLAHEGLDVGALVQQLRPADQWRRWICGAAPPSIATFGWNSPGRRKRSRRDEDEVEAFLHSCLVVRPWDDVAGGLGIRLSAAGLEVGARLGDAHLRTIRGEATLTLASDAPQTIRRGVAGCRVDQVFDHPVFRDRPYVITWSGDYDGDCALAPGDDPAWRVGFRAAPVAWRAPWAR